MIKKVSYKDQVYEYIKQAIIVGDMKAGECYSEQMVADSLGVSRTPVREAILQLKFENLVDVTSGRGFSVRPIYFSDVQQIMQARKAIEGASLGMLAEALGTAEGQDVVRQMKDCLVHGMQECLTNGASYDFMKADMEFHMLSVAFTGNEFFIHIMQLMHTRLEQAIVSSLLYQDRHVAAMREHEKIVAALLHKDGAAAIAALAEHMRVTESILREIMPE